MVAQIDTTLLATHMGVRREAVALEAELESKEAGVEEKTKQKAMDVEKAALVEALTARCNAIVNAEDKAGEGKAGEGKAGGDEAKEGGGDDAAEGALRGQFEASFLALSKWANTDTDAFAMMRVKRERKRGRSASALKILSKVRFERRS